MRARGDGDADGSCIEHPRTIVRVTTTTHRGFVHLLHAAAESSDAHEEANAAASASSSASSAGDRAASSSSSPPAAAATTRPPRSAAAKPRTKPPGRAVSAAGSRASRRATTRGARVAIGRDRRRMPSSRRGARARAGGDPRGDRAASARGDVAHPPAVAERRANPRVSRQARRDHHGARALPRRVPFPTLSASTRRRRCTHATRGTRPLGAFAATLERADATVRRGFEPLVNARACRCGASDAVAARLGPPTTWPNRVGARPPPLRNPAVPWTKSRGALTRSSAAIIVRNCTSWAFGLSGPEDSGRVCASIARGATVRTPRLPRHQTTRNDGVSISGRWRRARSEGGTPGSTGEEICKPSAQARRAISRWRPRGPPSSGSG